jgi:hypothetical protein
VCVCIYIYAYISEIYEPTHPDLTKMHITDYTNRFPISNMEIYINYIGTCQYKNVYIEGNHDIKTEQEQNKEYNPN